MARLSLLRKKDIGRSSRYLKAKHSSQREQPEQMSQGSSKFGVSEDQQRRYWGCKRKNKPESTRR